MASISIVLFITFAFVAANLLAQLGAIELTRREVRPQSKLPAARVALEHPFHARIDGMARTRTDRRDLQLAMGQDFAAPDVEESVWPRDPRT